MHFDADYCEHARLRDGREVVLRLIRPDDKELLRRGFLAMSPESRYRRFFTIKHELSEDELRYLTEIDGVRHFAMGAVTPAGEGLGVARFIQIDGEPGVAEAANVTYGEAIFGVTYPVIPIRDETGKITSSITRYDMPQNNGFRWILPSLGVRGRF